MEWLGTKGHPDPQNEPPPCPVCGEMPCRCVEVADDDYWEGVDDGG